MRVPTAAPPCVLIVEETAALRDLLETVLDDAGYAVLSACSLSDAATLLATRPCDLLLIDLTAPPAADPFAAVRALRDQAAPRPVGLLTTWTLSAAEAERQGFAFLVPMPFDLDRLLFAVAASIAQPLSPDQERQAHVVHRYFAALEARDWDALLALCTNDIRYVLPTPAPFATTLHGQAAFRAYT
ncbi:MAG: response regulator, partial [Chloroflexi bacterium]|nr:response regulator [Chloroflexota bacterium]